MRRFKFNFGKLDLSKRIFDCREIWVRKAEANGRHKASPLNETDFPPHIEALKKMRIIIRAAQRHSAWIQRRCGVSGAQLCLLDELSETPGLRVGELAGRMAIHQATVSNLIDVLEMKGLLSRQRDTADLRVVRLTLTKRGANLLRKAPGPAKGLLPEALKKMHLKELAGLDKGLQALIDIIDAGDGPYGFQPLPFTM